MPKIELTVDALVNDAIRGLKDVSAVMDDQKVSALELAQAQRKLEDALDEVVTAQIALERNTDPAKQRELENAVIDAGVAAQKHQKQVDGLAKEYTQLNTETKSAGMSLADIKAGFDMAGQVVEKVGRIMDATVIKAADWGDSMGDLAQLTGATVRETSTMAATFELMGVEIGTLESAMKTMTNQGLQLNLETLKKLAAEYQAIQDPVARNEFLFKKFGKAGLEMAEIMGRDVEEIEKLGEAAAISGKVIDEKAAAAAENLNVELEILKQRTEGAAITIGNMLIPTLNEWAAVDINREWLGPAIEGTIELTKAATDTTDAVDRQNERLTALSTTITTAAVPNVDALTASAERWKAMAAQAEAEAAMKLRLEDLTGAASDLQFGMGELTTATLFHQAAQGLDADAAYALAQQMGLIDPAADAAKQILDDLRVELEKGAITTGQYNAQVGLLDMAIRSLPDGKTITVTYLEEYKAALNDEANRGNDQVGGAIGDGYSHGTGGNWLTVPAGYPNDSYPIRLQSGEEFAVKRPGEGGPGGGLYIGSVNITAAPGQDAESLWQKIRVIAARDARAMSQAGV